MATSRKPQLTQYVCAGYADHQDRTPWKRAPMTYEEWQELGYETPEQSAYWSGWKASLNTTVYRIGRECAQTA